MAVTLRVGPKESATPDDFAPHWRAALHAIDRVNALDWASAWEVLYGNARTTRLRCPRLEFANRIEAVLEHPTSATRGFMTRQAYAKWLDHVEAEVLEKLRTIEDTLAREPETTWCEAQDKQIRAHGGNINRWRRPSPRRQGR